MQQQLTQKSLYGSNPKQRSRAQVHYKACQKGISQFPPKRVCGGFGWGGADDAGRALIHGPTYMPGGKLVQPRTVTAPLSAEPVK